MGIFSYVADVTNTENRTFRIGIVNLCISLGVPIGMAFSGVLLRYAFSVRTKFYKKKKAFQYKIIRQIGFYGIFTVTTVMNSCALLYGTFYVKESIMSKLPEKIAAGQNGKSFLADFFEKDHIVETFRVAFKSGLKNRRLRVCMLFIVLIVVEGPLFGMLTIICFSNECFIAHINTHV